MDTRKIKKLIDLMIESDIHALEVKEGDHSIAITRQAPQPVYQAPVAVASAPIAQANNATPSTSAPSAPQGICETSPMVGVFYAAPSPDEPAFVKVGQSVKAGQQLCIIEAMKIMNPIEASQDGIIEEVLVKNGDVVQFGQALFRFRA